MRLASLPPPPEDSILSNESHITFNSLNEFDSTVSYLLKLTDKDLDEWEVKNSFQSFRSEFNKAQEEWNNLDSIGDTLSLSRKYRDILTIDNGSLIPRIRVRLYQIICNRKGYYQTSNTMNRVDDQNVYSIAVTNRDRLYNLNTNTNQVLITNYYDEGLKNKSTQKTMGQCSNHMTASYYYNPSGCKNDRKAESYFTQSVAVFNDYITLIDGYPYYRNWKRLGIQSVGRGQKRNALCNWDDKYNTQHEIRNSYFTVNAYKNVSFEYYSVPPLAPEVISSYSTLEPFSWSLPTYVSPGESYTLIIFDELVGDWIVNEAITTTVPIQVHIEYKTRGIDNNWAIIDCQ